MLFLHGAEGSTQPAMSGGAPSSADPAWGAAVWIDLLDPTEAERDSVAQATGLRLPTLHDLSEIESSSRLRTMHDVLYLSTPLVFRSATNEPSSTPVGFVLGQDRLVTLRFAPLPSFETFARESAPSAAASGSTALFVGLLEAIIDRIADVLERVGGELDAMSQQLFRAELTDTPGKRQRVSGLRDMLHRIGRSADLASKIRDSLLGLGRIVPYVAGFCHSWVSPEIAPRLHTLQQDIASLNDYEGHLVNKVQLLLDATLGLINIEQNDTIRLLTVVSVVGVPPTLIASMYGMNFKHMPELDWAWGYPYGLALIALSAILPLVWFRHRGWL